MKLIVFGATGSIGRLLVDRALAQGHRVTAFARTPQALAKDHPNLIRRAGDVYDPAVVADAVRGQDAVLIALGAGRKGGIRATGTRHVVTAMVRHGVGRLVCLSSLGVGDSRVHLTFFWKHIMFGLLLRDAYADHVAQEEAVRRSDLDWTLVRPGAFTDGPTTGAYRHGIFPLSRNLTLKIARADVADFMVRQLTDPTYVRQAPILSN